MFVSGVSTHKVGEVTQTLMGVAPSASAVSRLNQTLAEQYEGWRERPLLTHYRVVYLDGVHFTVRHGIQTDATIILTALGVDLEGSRPVRDVSKDGWSCLLQDLRTRGVSHIDLLVTDGHARVAGRNGLSLSDDAAPTLLGSQTARVLMNAIPKREQQEVSAELTGIWKQEKKEDALLNLAAFTTETSCLTIVWAVMQDIRLPKIPVG